MIRAAAGLAPTSARPRRRPRTASSSAATTPATTPTSSPRDTAAVMTGAGLRALVLPRPLPTPVLAFAIRAPRLRRRRDGHRVATTRRRTTATRSTSATAARSCRRPTRRSPPRSTPSARWPTSPWRRLDPVDDSVVDAYLDADRRRWSPAARATSPRLHAAARRRRRVGRAVLERAGFPRRTSSPPRPSPTPTSRPWRSPTRRSPARWTSRWRWPGGRRRPGGRQRPRRRPVRRRGARRRTGGGCCAATRSAPCSATSCCARASRASTPPRSSPPRCSADRRGARPAVRETLTGFKWIGRVEGLAFGYEEALGYCVAPDLVRDKDGVSALLLWSSSPPRSRPRAAR